MDKRKKILIVEDDALTALWLRNVLNKLGHFTYEPIIDGESAINAALDNKPDLVIMDVWLSGEINGIEAAEIIQRECNSSIIFISGYSENDSISDKIKVSYLAYLKKPIESFQLEEVLADHFS